MSVQITTAFVEQYKSNVFHLAQQKGSKLRDAVRTESIVGKSHFFERIGSTAAVKRTSRHADTPRVDTPHSRRKVTMDDYDWADLIDDSDKVRLLISPQSEYAKAGAYAMAHDHVHGSNIEQCVIMVCTPDLYYQEFKIDGLNLRKAKHDFLKRLDQYHELLREEEEKPTYGT